VNRRKKKKEEKKKSLNPFRVKKEKKRELSLGEILIILSYDGFRRGEKKRKGGKNLPLNKATSAREKEGKGRPLMCRLPRKSRKERVNSIAAKKKKKKKRGKKSDISPRERAVYSW